MDLGRRIASARIEAGYTKQEDFATALSSNIYTVRNWEQGKSRPKHEMLERIAQLTGKPIGWFFGEVGTTTDLAAGLVDTQRRLDALAELIDPPQLTPAGEPEPGIVELLEDAAALASLGLQLDATERAFLLGIRVGGLIRSREDAVWQVLAALKVLRQ